ncbi:MAG: hypothetical protein R6W06_10310 [Prochlorococcaceae cyanobacterium]
MTSKTGPAEACREDFGQALPPLGQHPGLREGHQVEIVVGEDGRLSLEPLHQLQATMPLTPSVIEECRASERW